MTPDLPTWIYRVIVGVLFTGLVWFSHEWLDERFVSVHARLTRIEMNTEDVPTWKDRVSLLWQHVFGVSI